MAMDAHGVLNKVPIDVNNQMNCVSERVQTVEMWVLISKSNGNFIKENVRVRVCSYKSNAIEFYWNEGHR